MTVLEKVKVNKVNYEDFLKMIRNDEFKISEVNYSGMIEKKNHDARYDNRRKRQADNYYVSSVFNLFEEMCAEYGRIITMPEYLNEYMKLVRHQFYYSFVGWLHYEEEKIFENIMRLRGYSAYRSALAEVGLKLMLEDMYDNYIIHMNEETDQILGVDIVVENKHNDEAHYIHVTKESGFARERLNDKSSKKVEVFNYNTQQFEEYQRDFSNHIYAFYDDAENNCEIINGVYIFREEYIKELLDDNEGLCDKQQLTYLEYIDLEKNVEWVEE
ncbi:hypothetical protein AALF85_05305 [Jeotgalicoccus halotolerans]|uniref:hypothetical protein n=1 Tax=Jeotgalicoccus halotolerans TaxID=157227 RepID=UPI003514E2CF